MKLIYLYGNSTNHQRYCVHMEIWQMGETIRGDKWIKDFLMLEKITIHAFKTPDEYHSITFEHDLAKDSCSSHYAHTLQAFLTAHAEAKHYPMQSIEERNWHRLKKKVLEIYSTYPAIDYEKLKAAPTPKSRTIIW